MCDDRKHVSVCGDKGRGEGGWPKGYKEMLGAMNMYIILMMVMASWCESSHQVVRCKYV